MEAIENDEATTDFSSFELKRYERQIRLPGFGVEGQKRLKNASVLVSRVGGVGGTAAMHLARAGVGKLYIAHGGEIVPEYLNRMQLAMESDVGRSCTEVFVERLGKINSNVEVIPVPENINKKNVKELVGKADVVIDGAPLFEERYLMNQECVKQKKNLVTGAMYGLEGNVFVVKPEHTPCFACVYPEKPEYWTNIKVFPAIGPGPIIVGSMLAMEAIKMITSIGDVLLNKLWYFDLESHIFKNFSIEKDDSCQVCSHSA